MTDATTDWIQDYLDDADERGYVEFNLDRRLGQNQYISRHVGGRNGSADLSQGLRFDTERFDASGDYHSIRIHRDDLVEFHERVHAHEKR